MYGSQAAMKGPVHLLNLGLLASVIPLILGDLDSCFFNCEEGSYDLTHPVYKGIPAYPGLYDLAYDQTLAFDFPEPNFLLAFNYTISGLGGTSITAPAAFFPNSRQIHEIPHTQLVRVEGRVIDISAQVKLNPNYEATVDDIVCNENEYGCFGPATVVIFYTGWAGRWPNQERVFNIEGKLGLLGISLDPIEYNYPGITDEAARYLASMQNVYGVMIDTPGVDAGSVPKIGFDIYKSHRILARENKYVVQNANIRCTLPHVGLKIYILPLQALGGTIAPCRVFAHVCQDQCPAPLLPPPPPPPQPALALPAPAPPPPSPPHVHVSGFKRV